MATEDFHVPRWLVPACVYDRNGTGIDDFVSELHDQSPVHTVLMMGGGIADLVASSDLSCFEHTWQERKCIVAVLMKMYTIVNVYAPQGGRRRPRSTTGS